MCVGTPALLTAPEGSRAAQPQRQRPVMGACFLAPRPRIRDGFRKAGSRGALRVRIASRPTAVADPAFVAALVSVLGNAAGDFVTMAGGFCLGATVVHRERWFTVLRLRQAPPLG